MKRNNDYRTLYILGIISACLSLVVFIPFGKAVSNVENIIKLFALPVVVAVLNVVITSAKFREYRPTNIFQTYVSYLPIFSYSVALAIRGIFVLNGISPVAAGSYNSYVYLAIILALVAVGVVLLLNAMDKINISLSKNEVNVLDIACYVVFAIDVLVIRKALFKKYEAVELVNQSPLATVVCIVLGILIVGMMVLKLTQLYLTKEEFISRSKKELLALWQAERDETYYNAELEIVFSLNEYTSERIQPLLPKEKVANKPVASSVDAEEVAALKAQIKALEDEKKESVAKHNAVSQAYAALQNKVKVEVATTEVEALKKELETLNERLAKEEAIIKEDENQYVAEKAELDEKVAALVAEKTPVVEETPVEVAPVEKAPVVKKEKEFKPSYEEIQAYAASLDHKELSVVANATGNQHKFLVGTKPYLLMQKTSSDYRVTFFAPEEKLAEYLQGYSGLIDIAKTPKGGNWLKIVNTGELDAAFLKQLVKESLDAELAFEEAARVAKEQERLAKEEAKRQEKEAKEKLKEAERIIAKAAKDAEKAEREAEKRAKAEAAAQAKAQKELEKAVKEAEKAARKELEAEKAARIEAEKALEEAEKALEEAEKAA